MIIYVVYFVKVDGYHLNIHVLTLCCPTRRSSDLIGGIGLQAREPGDLRSDSSLRFQFGPSLRWPIFSGGRIRAQIRAADARAEAATARYERAVLTALADSETSINRSEEHTSELQSLMHISYAVFCLKKKKKKRNKQLQQQTTTEQTTEAIRR